MSVHETHGYLRSLSLVRESVASFAGYPFSLPIVQRLDEMMFHPKITFLVGENGSGKSTLIEALAVALGFNAEGGSTNFTFETASTHSELHRYIRLSRGIKRPKDGFFFRAESYYNLASTIEELDKEPSFGPPIIQSYGGRSLHKQSHGESFFSTFLHRFRGDGLYVLDEPEAALSPSKQLAMLARMHQLTAEQSQFIIATHSPILMAYPDAWIYQLTAHGIERTTWENTEHYIITKQFLNRPEQMMRELFSDQEEE